MIWGRMLIYPFSSQYSPILRHKTLMENIDVIELVSPCGWGIAGNDAGIADGGDIIGITVGDDFDEALKTCDTVLFADSNGKLDFNKFIYTKILKSIKANKNIIVTADIDSDIEKSLCDACKENNVIFQCYSKKHNDLPDYKIYRENILKIETPVIFILGLAENINKFELQLSIREELLKTGYVISQIGTRSYCEMFGIHNFPQFMLDATIAENMKVIMFNRYIKEIERIEKPDVIIVGIPGGILPFNNEFTNRFGILAVEVSMALKPDVAVLSIPFGEYTQSNYNQFTDIVKHRLGFDVDIINLSNVMPDWLTINQGLEMSYVTVGTDFVDLKKNKCTNLNTPVFNVFNKNDSVRLTECIINKLAEYGEIEML